VAARKSRRAPQIHDVYEAKNKSYEGDRRIRIVQFMSPEFPNSGVMVETTWSTKWRRWVGRRSWLSFDQLRKEWVFVRNDGEVLK
jgi:hypothetical protein